MGTVILGYHKKPLRILIDSVDSDLIASINGRGESHSDMRIDERGISDGRMHNHRVAFQPLLHPHLHKLYLLEYLQGTSIGCLWNGYHDGYARLDFVLLSFLARDAD